MGASPSRRRNNSGYRLGIRTRADRLSILQGVTCSWALPYAGKKYKRRPRRLTWDDKRRGRRFYFSEPLALGISLEVSTFLRGPVYDGVVPAEVSASSAVERWSRNGGSAENAEGTDSIALFESGGCGLAPSATALAGERGTRFITLPSAWFQLRSHPIPVPVADMTARVAAVFPGGKVVTLAWDSPGGGRGRPPSIGRVSEGREPLRARVVVSRAR